MARCCPQCEQWGVIATLSGNVAVVPALSLKLVARRHIDYGRTRSMICMPV
jgi:hypothetical protein